MTKSLFLGKKRLAANAVLPEDEILRDIAARLPTTENGEFCSIEAEQRVPETVRKLVSDRLGVAFSGDADAYVIDTLSDKIHIWSESRAGVVYGLYTLLQQARTGGGEIPAGVIYNTPQCEFRGLKVYLPAPEQIDEFYKLVDMLCYFRYNKIIVEIGGAMEYRQHPEIGDAWVEFCKDVYSKPCRNREIPRMAEWDKNATNVENGGGKCLTQDAVRSMVRYCEERGIEFIPEMPALSHAYYMLMAHPELAERPEDSYPDTYCPSNPNSRKLYFELLEEVIDVCRPSMINIGHDEYYSVCVCPRCKEKKGDEVFADDINQIHAWLKTRNIRVMLWSDKLINAVGRNGAPYGGAEYRFRNTDGSIEIKRPATYRAIDLIPKDCAVLHWYWYINEYWDEDFLSRGMGLIYGNFNPMRFLDWQRRLCDGASGAAPSNWSFLTEEELQRQGVSLSIAYGARMFWDSEYNDEDYETVLEDCFEELFSLRNSAVAETSHFELVHATTITRKYKYGFTTGVENRWNREEDELGKYRVVYEDETAFEIPIVYGVNIANKNRVWTRGFAEATPYKASSGSYSAPCRDQYDVDDALHQMACATLPIRDGADTYFKIIVKNPYPDKHMNRVEIIKTSAEEGDILLRSFSVVRPKKILTEGM